MSTPPYGSSSGPKGADAAAPPEAGVEGSKESVFGELSSGVRIQPMRRSHAREAARIASDGMKPPWTEQVFRQELALGERRFYLVALEHRRVIGVAGLLPTVPGAEAHVTIVVISSEFRGRGVGRLLLIHLAHEAIRRGADALTLEVRPSNEPAMALYRSFGFAPEGVRKGYYTDTDEDALILWARGIQDESFATRMQRMEKIGERIQT